MPDESTFHVQIVEHVILERDYTRDEIEELMLSDKDAVDVHGYDEELLGRYTDDELVDLIKRDGPMTIMDDMESTADTVDTQWEVSTKPIEPHWWEKRIGEIAFGRDWWNDAGERLYHTVRAVTLRHISELERIVK